MEGGGKDVPPLLPIVVLTVKCGAALLPPPPPAAAAEAFLLSLNAVSLSSCLSKANNCCL